MGEDRLGQILRPNKSTQHLRSSPSGRCTEEGTAAEKLLEPDTHTLAAPR